MPSGKKCKNGRKTMTGQDKILFSDNQTVIVSIPQGLTQGFARGYLRKTSSPASALPAVRKVKCF